MPEVLKGSQIGSSPLPPPFRGLHSPGVRKHCQIIFACYFRKSSINGPVNHILTDSARYDNTKVKLIILTYMRSGSSFTGDLFNNHPSVFYVFEPLWSTQKYFNKGVPIHFIDKASA